MNSKTDIQSSNKRQRLELEMFTYNPLQDYWNNKTKREIQSEALHEHWV